MTESKMGRARAAKRAKRLATQADRPSPLRKGMSGGRYKPLTDDQIHKIHSAALHVLETVGMGDPSDLLIELATANGSWINEKGRLCFPRGLIEDLIAGASKELVLYGRDSKHDLEIAKERVYFGTGGAAISVLDFETGQYRDSTLVDIYDFARLVDQLPNVDWFTRSVIATELSHPMELDINTAYALAAGTQKHVGTAITLPENVAPVVALFDIVAGGQGKFQERPFCKLHSSPIIPPLRYGADALGVIVEAMKYGFPINAITAGQSGATAPATLAGTLVQTFAETLAALAFVNLIEPGYPFIFSNWPFVSDLRTGAMTGGSAEGGLLNAAAAQLANFYDLPSGVAGGMPDSKIPDVQSGYENVLPNTLAGLAGANLIYESSGMLASLLGCSFEAFVINDEALGSVNRAIRGIEVTDETLGVDTIADVVNDAGHFLGTAQTMAVMETEYLYPALGDRATPTQWAEVGAKDMWQRAREKVQAYMQYYPNYITEKQDQMLRSQFDIRLPSKATAAHAKRWR